MFDSLKSKLKGIFKKGNELDSEKVYEEPAAKPAEVPPQAQSPAAPAAPAAPVAPAEPAAPAKTETKPPASRPAKGGKRADEMLSTSLLGKKIKDDPLDDLLDALEVTLLESDVAYPVVQEIILGVRANLAGKKYSREYSLDQVVELAVKDAVRDVLKVNEFDFDAWIAAQPRPTVIMFVGINGTGKTTAIAKIANRLKKQGLSVVMAACDTFRAGAIEQLSIHAERLDVKIVKHDQNADPASVAYDAIEHAQSKLRDVVLIDTAGRMQTNNNLIAEMKKIAKVAKPSLKVFVGDALAGNDAIEQAKVFDEAIGIDAVILTKIDTDAKGGAALSIAKTIGKPIAFVCDGQEYDDIEKFDAEWMLERLFDQPSE